MAKTRKFKTKIIITKMRTGPLVQRDLKNSKCIFVAVYVALLAPPVLLLGARPTQKRYYTTTVVRH